MSLKNAEKFSAAESQRLSKSHDPKPKALPSREDILAYIARERSAALKAGRPAPAKITKRDIAKAFDIKGQQERIALKALLKDMESDGAVERRHKVLHRPGQLPGVVLADISTRDKDGEFIAKPAEWDEEHGPIPRILVFAPKKGRMGTPVAGLNDRVLLRVEPVHGKEKGAPDYTGRVIKILDRAKTQMLGIYRDDPKGGGRISPIDKKNANKGELQVMAGNEGDARDGDLVSIEVLRAARFGLPSAKVRERLGSMATEKAVSLIAIYAHNIPNVFRPETIAESEAVKPAGLKGREDWRDLALITIDPPDAKDHDDAVHAVHDPDPANPGGFIITVAIADVSAYVRPGRALDREALDRGNSVYFPDRVVPMLPERISNNLCSLRAGEDRPALAVRMKIAENGRKISHRFHRIMMRSAAKLAYAEAQAAIDGTPNDTSKPILNSVLRPLYEAYEALKKERAHRSPLELDLPERKILLTPEGTVDRVVIPPRLDAHRLIEEMMILANVAAAETLEERRQQLIYRCHDEPSLEKLTNLSEFLMSIGIKIAKGQVWKPQQFNGILERVRGTENEALVNEVVLRSQAQAEYTTENYGHFGLHLRRYAHFTSPIRRYADLVVHRALIRALDLGEDGLPDQASGELAEVATRISACERRAMAAERDTVDRLIATHLATRIGTRFDGRISGVTKFGLFVKLSDTGADGFIPAATLGNDFFRFDEKLHALIGSRSGETHRLGDVVEVKLIEAAPFAGALRFELLSAGRMRNGTKATKTGRDTTSNGAKARKAAWRTKKK